MTINHLPRYQKWSLLSKIGVRFFGGGSLCLIMREAELDNNTPEGYLESPVWVI